MELHVFQCDDYDDGGALIKSPFKHFQTNLRNYQRCHALKTISAPTMLRGGNSVSMWNMMMGTCLVIKSLGCIQNGGLQQPFG